MKEGYHWVHPRLFHTPARVSNLSSPHPPSLARAMPWRASLPIPCDMGEGMRMSGSPAMLPQDVRGADLEL